MTTSPRERYQRPRGSTAAATKTRTHACHRCGWEHLEPKGSRAFRRLLYAALFATVQILAGLELERLSTSWSWLAVALGALAARNIALVLFGVWGLSNLATKGGGRR